MTRAERREAEAKGSVVEAEGAVPGFQSAQYRFAAHLRDPARNPAPADVEDRRMGIYRDLIYKNIEGFIRGGFPVLHSILAEDRWHALIRDFVSRHISRSPYFLEISQEFLQFLQDERDEGGTPAGDPPFMLELAHYEWVELALDVSPEQFPQPLASLDESAGGSLLDKTLIVSPLAWCLSYQYPVHLIGPNYQPSEPPQQPTFLIVYRNCHDRVHFMESNAVTVRLLALIQSDTTLTGRAALLRLAEEMRHPAPLSLVEFGSQLLQKLQDCHILCAA